MQSHTTRVTDVEAKYYADGEDAIAMRRDLTPLRKACVRISRCVLLSLPHRSSTRSRHCAVRARPQPTQPRPIDGVHAMHELPE